MSILQYLVEHYQYFTSYKGRCNIRLCQLWMAWPPSSKSGNQQNNVW